MTLADTHQARALRRRQTDVEAKLWARLRDRRLAGLKFRRQVPRGHYIVDFLCDEAMLIVELDGSQHLEPRHMRRDSLRTSFLESNGYQVLRFWNCDINGKIDSVLNSIVVTAEQRTNTPSSALRAPSPQWEKATILPSE